MRSLPDPTGQGAPVKIRRLPLVVPPFEDEAFASYIDRIAEDLQATPAIVLAASGILQRPTSPPPRAYGVGLPKDQLAAFAKATGLPAQRVGEMLLTAYAGIAFEIPRGGSHRAAMQSLRSQWLYLCGSHVCPSCLRERQGAWRLSWKLPWSFACARHYNLLLHLCPACGRRTGAGRSDRATAPAGLARIPSLGCCSNPLAVGREARSARTCGASLTQAAVVEIEPQSRLMRAERSFDSALRGAEVRIAGRVVPSLEYLASARGLCALILHSAEVEDLGEVPPRVSDVFAAHCAERAAKDRQRMIIRADGGDGRTGPRTRSYARVPEDPAVIAAIAPLAVETLNSTSRDSLTKAVAPLVARARERNASYVSRLALDFGLRGPLRTAFDRHV